LKFTAVNDVVAPRLAAVIAARLAQEIVDLGWPIGEVLGSQQDLAKRFGASRSVIRETIRILEHTGAVRVRPGPGGGLVVAQPSRTAVVASMVVLLAYRLTPMSELMEVRKRLQVAAVELAAARPARDRQLAVATLDEVLEKAAVSGRPRLHEVAELEEIIAASAANPILSLFIDSLADIVHWRVENGSVRVTPAPSASNVALHLKAYRMIGVAIRSGDIDAASRRMARVADADAAGLREVPPKARPAYRAPSMPAKGGEQFAAALLSEIERSGWPIGRVLGSEPELMERYDVGRSVLREGVRILQHQGAVTTKSGPNGGVVVTAPNQRAVVEAALVLMKYEGVTRKQISDAARARRGSQGEEPDTTITTPLWALYAEVLGGLRAAAANG